MGTLRQLFRNETNYNFVRAWRYGLVLSGVAIVLSLLSFGLRGLERGIDFVGGTAWEVPTSELSVGDTRDVLRSFGLESAKIQVVGGNLVRVQGPTSTTEEVEEVRQALAAAAGEPADQVAVTQVGPSWGEEISNKAIRALVFFFIAIAIYITWALRDWRMAFGALVAVVHDIIISVGVYSVLQLEVTPATLIAFLTILGFSLYDTVVVFDKLRENAAKTALIGRMTYSELSSLSMNQVLMRSLNTSITAILPVLSILVVGSFILGATTLEEFGVALLVGLLVGAYSSIFVATPIVVWLKERQPQYRQVRQRLERRPGEVVVPTAAEVAESSGDGPTARAKAAAGGGSAKASSSGAPKSGAGAPRPASSTVIPPRPRKQRRR
ncbi:MAG: protein translocase subunit SecF [Acidimicrobiia bacterium]|nr:protein translocase subunit SecF [Acidimicrobiia bacterium]